MILSDGVRASDAPSEDGSTVVHFREPSARFRSEKELYRGRLVFVDQTRPNRPLSSYGLAYPDYLYYRDHATTFAGLAAHYATAPLHVSSNDEGSSVLGSVVTANYFDVLRVRPSLGRFFTGDEDSVPGRNPVAVMALDPMAALRLD